ncbi:MAG: hypothetical protein PHI27_12725 [Eubacteriales bacterium]|nr:hypothetical protein [Eubacteriales bacterium]MDD3883087.1 hypothetical protein [Eubacteriales bacterium]MDD4512612.1 hypothetical protein [Eubacteriales bacterium]
MKRIAAAFLFAGILILVLINAAPLKDAAFGATKDFALNVFPALMPSLLIMMLYINGDIAPRSKRLSPALSAAVLGLMTGAPGSARLLLSSKENGDSNAERYFGFCATLSPMFILSYVSELIGDNRAAVLIFISQLITAISGGIFIALSSTPENARGKFIYQRKPFEETLLSCGRAMMCVLSLMILFSVLIRLIIIYMPLTGAARAISHAFLEIAGGAPELADAGINPRTLTSVMGAAVSFGGVCIFAQTAAFLRPLGVSILKAALLRVIQGALGGAICYLLYPFLCAS